MKSLDFKIDFLDKNNNLLKGCIDAIKIPTNEFEIIKKYVDQTVTVCESELKEISFRELENTFFNLPSELLDLQSVKVALIPCKQLDLYHNLIPYDKLEPDMVSSVFSPIIEPDSTEHEDALMLFASFNDYGFFVRFEYYNSHNNFKTEDLDCYSVHYADGSIDFNLI
jgi:hypothetical protein